MEFRDHQGKYLTCHFEVPKNYFSVISRIEKAGISLKNLDTRTWQVRDERDEKRLEDLLSVLRDEAVYESHRILGAPRKGYY